jgi:subtilisin-like proprotein convertase family protein
MTSLSRRTRLLAAPVALALAAGTLGALAAPASAATTTFTQNNAINLGDPGFPVTQDTDIAVPDQSAATPYPSQVVFPTHPGTITDVNLTMTVTSTALTDLDVMLVSPSGQARQIMGDVGGGVYPVQTRTFTWDDEAAANMPNSSPVDGDSYKPTDSDFVGDSDAFAAPAPASTGTPLSAFDGSNPSGTWKLFVMDDAAGDVHTITSWTLTVAMTTSPYPSTASVNGLPTVTDVNVVLNGVSTTYSDDINLLLVGPGNQQALLWGRAGGDNDLSGANITFDDEASSPLPDSAQITSGSYQPTDFNVATFPAPAPAASGSNALSVFDGLSPNGTWQLFAYDDGNRDLAVINSWSLAFTWSDIASPTGLVNIAGGAVTVTSTAVTLNVNATDPAPASGVTQMRFSNNGTSFSAYQPYATTAAWTLTSGSGDKTVYAQFKDADGNESAVVSDTVKLDVTGPKAKKLTPKKNAKDVKATTKIKIKASEALKKSTVTKQNVFLKQKGVSGKIKAKVKYDSAKKLIVLTPVDDLKGGKTYKVTVKNVQDVFGHKWDEKPSKSGAQPLKYSFTTA